MKKIMIFLILLVLFISIGAVSAEGNFTSLQNEIDHSTDSIVLQQDYIYDNGTDSGLEWGILINKTDFVIDGNGHTISGANQARIFNIGAGGITILNLNIVNGKAQQGSAICSYGSNFCINNSYFENNTAEFGGCIFVMVTSDEVSIVNSTFVNSTAKYASAIYAEGVKQVTIQNCTFKNLYAEETGGAIGMASICTTEIDNCTFINTKSFRNGGAVYLDTMRETEYEDPHVEIKNSRFINSTGDYGGALTILSGGLISSGGINKTRVLFYGTLNLTDCEFSDNTALYNAGAVYLSGLNATIKNTHFYRNNLNSSLEDEYYGGGLYIDFSEASIENCEFINNTRQGIYAYDSELNVTDTTFSNNGEAIHAVFSVCDLTNLTVENDIFILNETYYASNVHEIAKNIVFVNNTIDVLALPARYDSRDWGWVSSIKNQGRMGACWAFGTCAALESTLLKVTGIEYDLSENNMQNTMLQFSKSGIIGETEGGIDIQGTEYILSWYGVMPSIDDTYDESGKLSPLIITDDEKFHIFDAIIIEPRKNATDNDAVKNAILKCGAVVTAYNSDAPDEFAYNNKTAAFYQNMDNTTCHEISFVGWDDNFPASNFITTPPGNGAFIVKNSWGTDYGENGFFYISYYDTSVLNTSIAIGFIIENTENYTTNYQTDLSGHPETISENKTISYKNTYTAEYGPELISAVGTYFDADEEYTLEIYVNNELVHTQNGTAPFTGYHTVKLTEEIPIISGDNFTALMKKTSVTTFCLSRQHYLENVSLIDLGNGWKDIAEENKTFSLKVYTKDLAIYSKDLVKIYKNDSKFEVNIGEANETVTFEINGRNYTRVSDENGTARIAINLDPGNYTIKTTYNNDSVENNIEVLPTLIAQNLIKYFKNESQFYISLIDGEGNPVVGKNVTMNINGVLYNRETNENGTARLNINLSPNTYVLTAIDPLTGLQMPYNITVLSTLNAIDLIMTYKDGSKFNVTLFDGQGKLVSGVNVTMNINGVLYKRTTDANGTAHLNINLDPNVYILTAIDPLTGLQMSYRIIVLPKLTANDLVMTYKDGSTFDVTVVDNQRNVLANAEVTFNVNGVLYNRSTDSNGIARLNINLMPGEYIITSQYGEAMISNTITIKD